MPRILALILLCIALLWVQPGHAGNDPLKLHAGQSTFTPTSNLRYWVDPDPASTEQDAETALQASRFQPVVRWPPTFGFAEGVHWFALDLHNVDHPDESWLYVVEYALLDHLDLHLRYSNGREQRFVSGDREPYAARSVDHRHFNFALKLPPGQSVHSLLRVQTESSVQVPIAIYSDHAFLETHQRSQLGLGVYYGVLIGLLLYNLVTPSYSLADLVLMAAGLDLNKANIGFAGLVDHGLDYLPWAGLGGA